MMQPDLMWAPFASLVAKEFLRFRRVIGQTVLVPLVNSSLYLLIFGVSLGKSIQVSQQFSYIAFLIPGIVMMGVLNNSFQNSSSSIATSKFHGDLEDLRVVPLTNLQIVLAYGLGGLARGILVGIVTFSVGQAFYMFTEHHFLEVAHPFWLLFFLVVGGIAFSFLGLIVAFKARSIDQLSAIGGFILLPLLYLGGVFFPLRNLHPFWQALSKGNPMLYFINGVRFGILGVSDVTVAFAAAFSLITAVVFYYGALIAVRQGPYQRW